MGRMARMEERVDVIELSGRKRSHVGISKVTRLLLFICTMLKFLYKSHDIMAKYRTAKFDPYTCKQWQKNCSSNTPV